MHIYDRYKLTRERIVKLQKANDALKKDNSVLDKAKFKATFGVTIPHWEESLREFIMHNS
ncbi:MAG: sugar nucleotide-binding protein [Muribaculaceae bacterium]|nr:sugar nucleotide-binding protein [Muribaculaceae bacterium]